MDKLRKLWNGYSLSIVLFALFLMSWVLQTWGGWNEYAAEQMTHNETPTLLGSSGYIWTWVEATFENWQSEFLQLLSFVILSTYLIHKNSPQSRDGDDEMKGQLSRIERRLDSLEQPYSKYEGDVE